MSRKSELTFMKKEELVNIILRKDNVEKELKEKNEELTSQVNKLTEAQKEINKKNEELVNAQKESNKKNGNLTSEIATLKETIKELRTRISEKENEIFNVKHNSSIKTIAIVVLAVIAIIGWII